MNSNEILFKPIGIIHTPFSDAGNMPIQPVAAEGIGGHIEMFDEFVPGLKDLDGFSHITLIYYFHHSAGFELEVVPFMDTEKRGVFATKAPKRPNAIGLSTVKLISIEGNIIKIEQTDMMDGTPLLDIKPFYPGYDNRNMARTGWLGKNKEIPFAQMRSDDRFIK